MIASLPMYWRAETADLWRTFWSHVQRHAGGLDLPDLTPPEAIPEPWTDHWLRPDLALSMTCGLPFRTALKDRVTYVGTLDFDLQAPRGHYYSCVLEADPAPGQRAAKTRDGLALAYNAPDSQSGWAVTQAASPFNRPPVFDRYLRTGSHAASLAAVAEGRADMAYVDAVTWRILTRHDANAQRVHVSGRSVTTPGLPLITAAGTDPEPLRDALRGAVSDFAPDDAHAMGGPMTLHVLDIAAYYAQPTPSPPPTGD